MTKIIKDQQIQHRSDTRGVVITRVQTIEIDGQTFEARHWTQFETGKLHHVDSSPVAA